MTEANRRDQDAVYPWRKLLQQWSRLWLAPDRDETERRFPDSAHETQWLGYGGATEAQIIELERLLGTALPPSYRQFLAVTDGWIHVDDTEGPLLPTTEIGWLKDTDPGFVATWGKEPAGAPPITDSEYFVYGEGQDCVAVRREYFRTALQISEWGDSALLLLNPAVVDERGEWEAWAFANWYPGAFRYRSFWDPMNQLIKDDYPDAGWSDTTLQPTRPGEKGSPRGSAVST